MYIKSYSQLKERKELKKEQLTNIKARLQVDYYHLVYTKEKVKSGFDWWKKIVFGIEVYKQAKGIYSYFKKKRDE